MTSEAARVARPIAAPKTAESARRPIRPQRVGLHVFLIAISLLWLFPLAWAIYTSLRPFSDTSTHGYFSLPGEMNLDNYFTAWNQGEMRALLPQHDHHRHPGRGHRAVPGLDDGLRLHALQLALQPRAC